MEEDVYRLGLAGRIDPDDDEKMGARIIEARLRLLERLEQPELASLVEPFDANRYSANLSVAENLLFGAPKNSNLDLQTVVGA